LANGTKVDGNKIGYEPTAASNQVVACAAVMGSMLWFMRKKFVGSYLFFKAARRS
jgi:hypothetical protein